MKLKEFTYIKQNGSKKDYEVLVLSETDNDIVGVSFNALSEDERKEIADLYTEFNERLEPYVKKAFRKFLKSGIEEKTEG